MTVAIVVVVVVVAAIGLEVDLVGKIKVTKCYRIKTQRQII